MRRPIDLLLLLYRRGARFWVEAGVLRYEAPTGAISPQELNEIRICKLEIMALLKQTDFATEPPLTPREPGCVVPLTPIQGYAWQLLRRRGTLQSVRFCSIAVQIVGRLDVAVLQKSIATVVTRHESLRTRLVELEGVPRQCIDVDGGFRLQVCDLQERSASDVVAELRREAEMFADEKIDVSVGPLFAARLFRSSAFECVLILAMDHLVSDGVSLEIIDREVWAAYEQGAQGLPIFLPDMPVQLADYAVWEERTCAKWKNGSEQYWRERFRDAKSLMLPRDSGLAQAENMEGEVRHFSFGQTLSMQLHTLARREQVLTPLVVLSIYVAVMSRWYRRRDLTIVFVSNGRYRPELRNVVGFLADMLYLRIEIGEQDTFSELLRKITAEFYSANDHSRFNRMVALVPEGITDMIFNWQPYSWIPWLSGSQTKVAGALTLRPFQQTKVHAMPFAPYFFETGDGIGGTVVYRRDLFSSATIEWFVRGVLLFAQQVKHDPSKCLSGIADAAVTLAS